MTSAASIDIARAAEPALSEPAQRAPHGDPTRFMLGDWLVDVPSRRLMHEAQVVTLEPRHMAVLAEMCRRPREVIGAGALLDACWPDETAGDGQVHKAIAILRRALQDSATEPRYIETIRKQGYRLVAPIRVLSQQGPLSHQGGWRGQSPFRGLEPFDLAHASVFFGRNDAVAALHARLGAQWRQGRGLVLLLGPSGSGKTSLVQAGLLPAMRAAPDARAAVSGGETLRACTAATVDLAALSDLGPWCALAGALLDWECDDAPLLAGHSIDTLARTLRERCDEVLRLLRIGLEAGSACRGDDPPRAPPLLVLDRLEALFQPAAEPEAAAFVECIDRLASSRLLLVLAVCRNDFYARLAHHPALMRDKERGGHMDLAPPDAEAIAQIIRLPARAADLIYGTDPSGMNRLDDRLCADAMRAPDALPLLQYALQALYLSRAPGNELSWAAYEAMGRLEGAIGQRAEAILESLPQAQQEALANLLPRLMGVPVADAAPTGRWVAEAELEDDAERALAQAFVAARLLVADRVAGSIGFRVAHEALLRRWPRVTQWAAQHRAGLVAREELAPWVHSWLECGRAATLLLPQSATLWQAARAIAEAPRLFGRDEREYVMQSQARIRRHARWRLAAAAGAAALALATTLAAFSYAGLARVASQRESESQRLSSFMLGDLADRLRPIGRLELLQSIGEQGLKQLGRGVVPDETPQDTLLRAKALVVIGEVNSSRGKGQTDIAAAALRQAGALLEPLAQAHGANPAEVYKTLGASAFWLGQIAFDAGDLATAAREMARYREACEHWQAAAPADAQAQAELGFAQNSLGSIAFKRGAWAEADKWFHGSLAAKQALLADRPRDTELLDAIANSRFWLASTAHVQGRPKAALALYDAARAAQAGLLAAHPQEASRLHDLSVTDANRAETLAALGRRTEAAHAMAAAVAGLRQAAAADASNRRWLAEALQSQAGLALLQLDAGLPVMPTLAELEQDMAQAAATASGSDLWGQIQARLATARAELSARQGDWRQARSLAAEADRIALDVLRLAPHTWRASELVARLGLLDMQSEAALGDARAKTESCARTRDRLQPAVDSGQGGLVLEAWLLARACSGAADVDRLDIERLVAGGYIPTYASLFQATQHGRYRK
jgi:DNA-binding winged helix-turn-helix (wHTH) protein